MIESIVTRRKFLKYMALWAGAFLAACTPNITPNPTPTILLPIPTVIEETAIQAETSTPPPVIPEKPVEPKPTLIDELMKPLIENALRKRELRRKNEPEWTVRIDEELNTDRINFLVYGYGKALELKSKDDKETKPTDMGSSTIISYNTRTKQIDFISFTHDIRAPEIEQFLITRGKKPPAQKIDRAFPIGGFDLMKYVHENATGLAVDYQIVFKDVAIKKLIEQVFQNGIEVDIPEDFDVQQFLIDNQQFPDAHFKEGKQILTGLQAVQYIKSVASTPKTGEKEYPGKSSEHKSRMYGIFTGLLNAVAKLDSKTRNNFLTNISKFIASESKFEMYGLTLQEGTIQYDADTIDGMRNLASNILTIIPSVRAYIADDKRGLDFPPIRKTIYVHDDHAGDGGVIWVSKDDGDSRVQRDFAGGVYSAEYDFAVPREGHPYDPKPYLAYWPFLRNFIKVKLIQ